MTQDIGRADLDHDGESAHWKARYTLRCGATPTSHDVPSFLEPVQQMVLETGATPVCPSLLPANHECLLSADCGCGATC